MGTVDRPTMAEHLAARRGVSVERVERELRAMEGVQAATEALCLALDGLHDVLIPPLELGELQAEHDAAHARGCAERAVRHAESLFGNAPLVTA